MCALIFLFELKSGSFIVLPRSPQTLNLCSKCYKDGKQYSLIPASCVSYYAIWVLFIRLKDKVRRAFSRFLYSELQRKGKPEDRNAAVSENKSKLQGSILKQSKQDLGKGPSSTKPNSEIQHDRNNSKCMKTETVTAAEVKESQETSEERESSNDTTENEPDVSKNVTVQKKRKRCWTCNAKLELAQRELGNCRCSKYCIVRWNCYL